MANAASIMKVAEIIRADKYAKYIVVSAPGKREKTDTKVTDLLYGCFDAKMSSGMCDTALAVVEQRFKDIIAGLSINLDLSAHFDIIRADINGGASKDYVASRGEYLSAIVMAKVLGYNFIDATEIICFNDKGIFEPEITNETACKKLKTVDNAVIPGFYGTMPNKSICTFSRGGSDVSGSIIARAVSASVYENWTDVDGFMVCDPRIVENPQIIEMLTYKELRELSYMGANVLHPDSIFPVRKSDITINIKNTFNPSAPGTLIVPTGKLFSGEYSRRHRTITGIAGRMDFSAIYIEKSMMNGEVGFARKLLSVLEKYDVNMEHMPSGIDTLSVIMDGQDLHRDTVDLMLADIASELHPDNLEYVDSLAVIAVVGHGMSNKKGTAARICNALTNADVNIRMIDQGSTELNIIIAVENSDYKTSLKAIYDEFRKPKTTIPEAK